MKPTLLVLAAGMGSRYGGLKQLDAVGPSQETIIDYSVYDAIRAGFGKIVFVIRRDIETAFKEAIGSRYEEQIAVDYCYQELDALLQVDGGVHLDTIDELVAAGVDVFVSGSGVFDSGDIAGNVRRLRERLE